MLSELWIKDFAIIDELRLSFNRGLNIFTGETGAGKSILVDALGMVLGDKAFGEHVRTGSSEAVIEAVFIDCGGPLENFLKNKDLLTGQDKVLCIKRRITRTGRHQAYINGSAVPLGILADVGSRLVDIHGQHQHQTLLKVSNHIDILDDYGKLSGLREEFSDLYLRLNELDKKINKSEEENGARVNKKDFLEFQIKEIDSAGLSPGEDVELENSKSLMLNAEKINLLLGEALELLYEGDAAAAGQVETAALKLEHLAVLLPEAEAVSKELNNYSDIVREAAGSLKDWMRQAEYDPEEHNRIEERLAVISRLKRKYGATIEEILKRKDTFKAELEDMENIEYRREEWLLERKDLINRMSSAGEDLSLARQKTAQSIEKQVIANLSELGMEKADFSVNISPRIDPEGSLAVKGEHYHPWEKGLESAEFIFSANPGEEKKSLIRVASGGELSRIMLAIKTSLARVERVMTLIFDEIDTGIGGNIARVVGRKLKDLSKERQVICVTHLPQIASLADTHFLVTKKLEKRKTSVGADILDTEGRTVEIARMIAGEKVTQTAVKHARELMEDR